VSIGDAMARFKIATMKIRAHRSTPGRYAEDKSLTDRDRKTVEDEGFKDIDDYWRLTLAQEMTVREFVELLDAHLVDPERVVEQTRGQKVRIDMLIQTSLKQAWDNGESWFIRPANKDTVPHRGSAVDQRKDLSRFPEADRIKVIELQDFNARPWIGPPPEAMLHPREAALWLLARPLHADRVPATLRTYLENDAAPPDNDAQNNLLGLVKGIHRRLWPPHGDPPEGARGVKARVEQELKPLGRSSVLPHAGAGQERAEGRAGKKVIHKGKVGKK